MSIPHAEPEAVDASPLEVEQKYRVTSHEPLLGTLRRLNAEELPVEVHCDIYLQHPSRDFAVTGEAFRIREVNDSAVVTYKGPRHAGPIKVREELEIPLVDQTSQNWLQLLVGLGFCEVARIYKNRQAFSLDYRSNRFTIALDDVDQLGKFVEIEAIIHDRQTLPRIQTNILELAELFGIDQVEIRSYLRQWLEQRTV